VGDRMLAARLAGIDTALFHQAEWRRGTLPPGPLGMRLLADLAAAVEPLAEAALRVHVGPARALDVVVDLGERTLTGTVNGIHGSVLASTSYSTLGPKHRLTAWANLLAVAATGDGAATTAVTTGRGPYRKPVWRSTLTVPRDPVALLQELVELYDQGLCEPLPIATGASAEYAARRARGCSVDEARDAAAKEWGSLFGDGKDRHLGYVFGTPPSFDRLNATPADGDEPTRFGALARRLWAPLLAHEQVAAP